MLATQGKGFDRKKANTKREKISIDTRTTMIQMIPKLNSLRLRVPRVVGTIAKSIAWGLIFVSNVEKLDK